MKYLNDDKFISLLLTPRFIAGARGIPSTDSNRFNSFSWMETVKTVRIMPFLTHPPRSIAGLLRAKSAVTQTPCARHHTSSACDLAAMRGGQPK